MMVKVTNVTRMVCVLSSLPSFPAEFGLTEPMEKKKRKLPVAGIGQVCIEWGAIEGWAQRGRWQ